MGRAVRIAGCVAVLAGAALTLDAPGARASSAVSIDDSGWWWRLQDGPVALPGPPNVEEGQLLVQGGPNDAIAIAAIAATLPSGEGSPILTLRVAEGGAVGGEDAIVLACQSGTPWEGGDAKPWSEKPQPACDAGGVTGTPNDDGTAFAFDLSALQFDDQVNVVIAPGTVDGQPDGANGSTFSLVFEEPTRRSIQTSPQVEPPPTTPPADGGVTPPADGGTSLDPPSDGGGLSLPPVDPSLPDDEEGLTPIAPSVENANPPLPASVFTDPRSEHARTVGTMLLLLGGGVVYWTTKRQAPVGAEGTPGGLGRFARPRLGAPPALRG